MSRWICVDDICIPSDENDWEELVAFADMVAEQEPIEIIRCSECKYYEAKEDWCYWRDEAITADDFCSYGRREERSSE